MKVKAAVQMTREGALTIRDIELEEPCSDEVLVKIVACGICHTDVMMQHSSPSYPFLLGHEGSGVVERVGKSVRGFEPGDSVIISYTSCGQCPSCLKHRPYQCDFLYDPFFFGYRKDGTSSVKVDKVVTPTLIGQGAFAEYAVVHQSSLVKINPSLDLRVLAPLGCGVMTGAGAIINYLKPEKGSAIAIVGLGAVGFGAVTAAKISECSKIIAIDQNAERLTLSKAFGATHVINTCNTDNLTSEIKRICGRLDYGYDSTGNAELLSALEQTLKLSATACGVGGGSLDGFNWQTTDEGFSVPQKMIPQIIGWHQSGQFPIEKLLHFYPFEKVNEAIKAVQMGTVIKPVLVM